MNNQMIVRDPMALMVSDNETDVKNTARKLMRLTPGGNRLNADQAADLAVYALLTGLNPFNNECYYMDKVGPVPGIAGYRVKTTDWLMATSDHPSTARTWEEYRPAELDEADFDPDKGDIAWVCTLFDSVSKERWEGRLIQTMTAYHNMGATFQEARETAMLDIGPCPSWSSVGVVKSEEHFSGFAWVNNVKTDQYKPEMWDRNERAKKRAAKGCYRKGFPNVRIPDAEFGEVVEGIATEIKDEIVKEITAEASKPKPTESQILADLGYDQFQGEMKPETETTAQPAFMTLEMALTETTSDGTPYGQLNDDDLRYRFNSLEKSLKNPSPKSTPEQIETAKRKRDAVKVILDSRK